MEKAPALPTGIGGSGAFPFFSVYNGSAAVYRAKAFIVSASHSYLSAAVLALVLGLVLAAAVLGLVLAVLVLVALILGLVLAVLVLVVLVVLVVHDKNLLKGPQYCISPVKSGGSFLGAADFSMASPWALMHHPFPNILFSVNKILNFIKTGFFRRNPLKVLALYGNLYSERILIRIPFK